MQRDLRALVMFFAVALLLASPRTVSSQLRIFRDTFDDGNEKDGMPGTWMPGASPGGTRDVSSGDFSSAHTGEMSTRVEELNGLRDVSIRSQVTFEKVSGNRDFASVWARSTPLDPVPSYWGTIDTNGLIAIGFTTGGTPSFLSSLGTSLDPIGQDVHLRFDVIGDQLSLFAWQEGMAMPLLPQLTATDSRLVDGGNIGVSLTPNINGGANKAEAIFRWFSVFDPAILPCDLNLNGDCDVTDLDAIYALGDLIVGVPVNAENDRFDVDAEFIINMDDVESWLSIAADANGLSSPYLYGDANLDGNVNATDLNALALNWRSSSATWSTGDFTGEGDVDAADLNELALNWQQSIFPAAAPVPEPAILWQAVMYLVILFLRCGVKRDGAE